MITTLLMMQVTFARPPSYRLDSLAMLAPVSDSPPHEEIECIDIGWVKADRESDLLSLTTSCDFKPDVSLVLAPPEQLVTTRWKADVYLCVLSSVPTPAVGICDIVLPDGRVWTDLDFWIYAGPEWE